MQDVHGMPTMATTESNNDEACSFTPCPAVRRFIELLEESPKEFDIAILSEKPNDNLQDAVVIQDATFLGVNALDLPCLACNIRRDYWKCRNSSTASGDLESVTKCLLLLCPDHATAWADRRRYLLRLMNDEERQEALCDELVFVNLLMTRHTKAPSSWFHRKWVLQQLHFHKKGSLIQEELQLCTRVAEQHPKNYYAWTHRLYCMHHLQLSLLQSEWEFCLDWISKHVSDHSAAHYGGQVLMRLSQVNSNHAQVMEIIQNGMLTGKRFVEIHPAHEVLWIFRRVCAHAMLMLLEKSSESDEASREYIMRHIEDEWREAEQSDRPKIGSELEIEWRITRVCKLSYIVWIARKCRLISNNIQRGAGQALRECDFIPYDVWRIEGTEWS